MKISGREVLF